LRLRLNAQISHLSRLMRGSAASCLPLRPSLCCRRAACGLAANRVANAAQRVNSIPAEFAEFF
jgi:hypothetical protein